MTDTPQHIRDLQLKIWLSKTPAERLMQFLKDNDDMRMALKKAKEKLNLPDTVTNFPSRGNGLSG
ncbi:MAG: hypothetical protein ABUT20_35680 [Bacteroidota bacterium]